jgi:hypothetical protein
MEMQFAVMLPRVPNPTTNEYHTVADVSIGKR